MASSQGQPTTSSIAHRTYPTQEHKNRDNLTSLLDKAEEYVRNVFHKHFPRGKKELYNALHVRKGEIDQLKRRKILNEDQYQLIFPATGETDSSQFDVTFTFLLIRALCGYTEPSTGWNSEPEDTDTSVIANCIRLKLARNKLNHNTVKIPTARYRVLFKYMSTPLLALGCPNHLINHLAPSLNYDVPLQNPAFVGREGDLLRIHQTLIGANNTNTTKTAVVITGIPGIGKSQLASKYIQVYRGEYDHIVWVNAEAVETAFQNIASILNLKNKTNTKSISHDLKEYYRNEKVLFVWDNVKDSGPIVNLLCSDHNIFTTQVKNWGAVYEVIQLGVWPEDIALKFVEDNMNTEKDLHVKLIETLGCHPLGIQHAISFLQQTGETIQTYLEAIEKYDLDILSEEATFPQGVNKSVFASFHLTIKHIEKTELTACFKLLSVVGILDGSFMNEKYLKRFCVDENGADRYWKAKKTLLDYSIVKCNERVRDISGEKDKYLTIHVLYQYSILYYLQQNGSDVFQIVEDCLTAMLPLTNYYEEGMFWANQLQYLWNKPDLKQHIINCIGKIGLRKILEPLIKCGFDNLNFEMLETIVESQDLANVGRYIAKSLTLENNQEDYAEIDNLFDALLENTNDPPEKNEFVKNILAYCLNTKIFKEKFHTGVAYFVNGDIENDQAQYVDDYFLPNHYKELGDYDQALKEFIKFPECHKGQMFSYEVEIACIYILTGRKCEGMDMVQKLHFCDDRVDEFGWSLLQIGRALFDCGSYEESKNHFQKYCNFAASWLPSHQVLDGISKIMIFDNVIDFSVLREQLLVWVEGSDSDSDCDSDCDSDSDSDSDCDSDSDSYSDWFKFDGELKYRIEMLTVCCLIRENRVSEAESRAEEILKQQQEKNAIASYRHKFREPLLIGKYLKLRGEYKQALNIFRLVARFHDELGLRDKPELNGVEIEVDADIEYCRRKVGEQVKTSLTVFLKKVSL